MARVVVPLASGFEDAEFTQPADFLRKRGHEVVVVGKQAGERLRGKRGEATVEVDEGAEGLRAADFDAMLIPGGHSPDALRTDPHVVSLVRDFWETGRPMAVICHGPQLLIEAGLVRGRTLTSWPSVKTDLENAGAHWVDRPVVEDEQLITSRKPEDLDAFCEAFAAQL